MNQQMASDVQLLRSIVAHERPYVSDAFERILSHVPAAELVGVTDGYETCSTCGGAEHDGRTCCEARTCKHQDCARERRDAARQRRSTVQQPADPERVRLFARYLKSGDLFAVETREQHTIVTGIYGPLRPDQFNPDVLDLLLYDRYADSLAPIQEEWNDAAIWNRSLLP